MLHLGNLNTYFTNVDFIQHCEVLAKQYKANNRPFAEILKHTLYGEAVEKLCSNVLKLEQTDFSISTHDATKNNLKIEIKHTVKNSKWWTFKLSSYKFFLKNSNNLDYIFLCYVDSNNNCYLQYVANTKTFSNYIRESNFKDYYYNVDKAILDNQCYEIINTTDIPENLKDKRNEMQENKHIQNEQFELVRQWGAIRGIDGADFQFQFQRCLQEVVEIHEAYIENDMDEVQDAIGDSIVTLINLAVTLGYNAEDCLDKAFNVIKLRKGLNKNGSFVRYGKLNQTDKEICDLKQGNSGNEYFEESALTWLEPNNFKE